LWEACGEMSDLPGCPRVALPATALKDAARRQGGGLKAILDRGRRQRLR
jgi:hypothetical protein